MTLAITSLTALCYTGVTDAKTIQILLLPGLGGDHRMAYPQKELPYDVISCDLIEMHNYETIAHYAARFKDHLASLKIIDASRPLFLGGFSFGSSVAEELSAHIRCNGIIIIGGLVHGRELRSLIRFVGLHIIHRIPSIIFVLAIPFIRLFMRTYTKLSTFDIDLCIAMYKKFSKNLFRNAGNAVAKWDGRDTQISTLRIHGEGDQIIRPPKPGQNVILVPTAKHLVHFAQPAFVNRTIEEFVDRTMRRTG